jgi:hypothetical protein
LSGQLIYASGDWPAHDQGQHAQPPYVTGADTNSATRTYYANGQLVALRYADSLLDTYACDGKPVTRELHASLVPVDGDGDGEGCRGEPTTGKN